MSFLDKEARENCWNNRDLYWSCLDKNGDTESECIQFRKQYDKMCPLQWVKHFDRRRKYDKFKERMEKEGGFTPKFPEKQKVNFNN